MNATYIFDMLPLKGHNDEIYPFIVYILPQFVHMLYYIGRSDDKSRFCQVMWNYYLQWM